MSYRVLLRNDDTGEDLLSATLKNEASAMRIADNILGAVKETIVAPKTSSPVIGGGISENKP
ncbi:hypothetical protein PED39_05400 [Methanomassiliicoccales archaeon LGM-RCC1]|nr:hypothetical protein PED39_05400 [Methanomassiliicoccales archaeon LGM-RCC1]